MGWEVLAMLAPYLLNGLFGGSGSSSSGQTSSGGTTMTAEERAMLDNTLKNQQYRMQYQDPLYQMATNLAMALMPKSAGTGKAWSYGTGSAYTGSGGSGNPNSGGTSNTPGGGYTGPAGSGGGGTSGTEPTGPNNGKSEEPQPQAMAQLMSSLGTVMPTPLTTSGRQGINVRGDLARLFGM
jgi:hypothetical protein